MKTKLTVISQACFQIPVSCPRGSFLILQALIFSFDLINNILVEIWRIITKWRVFQRRLIERHKLFHLPFTLFGKTITRIISTFYFRRQSFGYEVQLLIQQKVQIHRIINSSWVTRSITFRQSTVAQIYFIIKTFLGGNYELSVNYTRTTERSCLINQCPDRISRIINHRFIPVTYNTTDTNL